MTRETSRWKMRQCKKKLHNFSSMYINSALQLKSIVHDS